MQEQSTAKIATTTSKTTKLDFSCLKEKPRLCLKSDAVGGYGYICSNDRYFLCCPNGGFSLIDKEGHEQKLNIKRDFSCSRICWSSYLQKNFLLSTDQKLYMLDPVKQQLTMVKSLRKNSDMYYCVCYEKMLVLWPWKINSSVEIYDLSLPAAIGDDDDDDKSIIKSLETPIQILQLTLKSEEVDRIKQVCFSSDGKYLGLVTYYFDNNGHDSGYDTMFHLRAFRHDGNEKLEKKKVTSIWECGSWLVALPDRKFLVTGRSEGELIVLDYSISAASINIDDDSRPNTEISDIEQVTYNTQSGIAMFAVCGTCLAIEGLEGEIRFYDL